MYASSRRFATAARNDLETIARQRDRLPLRGDRPARSLLQ